MIFGGVKIVSIHLKTFTVCTVIKQNLENINFKKDLKGPYNYKLYHIFFKYQFIGNAFNQRVDCGKLTKMVQTVFN